MAKRLGKYEVKFDDEEGVDLSDYDVIIRIHAEGYVEVLSPRGRINSYTFPCDYNHPMGADKASIKRFNLVCDRLVADGVMAP